MSDKNAWRDLMEVLEQGETVEAVVFGHWGGVRG